MYLDIEVGINRVAIKSLLEFGSVKVTATQLGLKPVSIKFSSKLVTLENGLNTKVSRIFENVLTKEPMLAHTPEIPESIHRYQKSKRTL